MSNVKRKDTEEDFKAAQDAMKSGKGGCVSNPKVPNIILTTVAKALKCFKGKGK